MKTGRSLIPGIAALFMLGALSACTPGGGESSPATPGDAQQEPAAIINIENDTASETEAIIRMNLDGAVLPILHLNGYKISNPTVFGRMTHEELEHFFLGCSWKPYFVEGDDPLPMHEKMAETLDAACIIAPTVSGRTARLISKLRPRMPIYAVTPDERVMRQMQLNWGVVPLLDDMQEARRQVMGNAIAKVQEAGLITPGDSETAPDDDFRPVDANIAPTNVMQVVQIR